jgi:hypothetical protein
MDQFFSKNGDLRRGFDPKLDLIALDLQNPDANASGNDDVLARDASEYKHTTSYDGIFTKVEQE